MRLFALSLIAASSLALSTAGSAQTADPPKKRENARVVIVDSWAFVPNGIGRAKDIWHNIYMPAMKQAGVPLPIVLHPDTGEWNMVIITQLGGYADLEYSNITPTDAKWWALVERKYGGADKALAIGNELQKLIARRESYIAHEHLDEVE